MAYCRYRITAAQLLIDYVAGIRDDAEEIIAEAN
jgi:hypothetical protein